MSILCCQKAIKIIQNLQKNLNMGLTPPLFEQFSKKNADLAEVGSPKHTVNDQHIVTVMTGMKKLIQAEMY